MTLETMRESERHEEIRRIAKDMIDAREIRNDERRENDRRFDQGMINDVGRSAARAHERIERLEKTIADLPLAPVRR